MREKNDKKGGWCSWLFQTFKTIKVVEMHGAINFLVFFLMNNRTTFCLPLSKLKQI